MSPQRIYNTIQCYLKDSHSRLLTELERARREVGHAHGARHAWRGQGGARRHVAGAR